MSVRIRPCVRVREEKQLQRSSEQLECSPASHAGDRGFESRTGDRAVVYAVLHTRLITTRSEFNSQLPNQLVECKGSRARPFKAVLVGSSPTGET